MKNPQSPNRTIPHIHGRRLFASTPEQQAVEHRKAEELTQYRRTYWQDYKKKVRRVFGSLKPAEFDFWAQMAKNHGRSIWGQIYACACAYVGGLPLATEKILASQNDLLIELQRIGNNLNQAVRLGHITANKNGQLSGAPDDKTAQAVLQYMQQMQRRMSRYESDMSAHIPARTAPHATANPFK